MNLMGKWLKKLFRREEAEEVIYFTVEDLRGKTAEEFLDYMDSVLKEGEHVQVDEG